jgi:flagellar biosynthetic protein FlhB
LYESVDVGQYIPERLYRVIAEILAYVYELAGRSVVTRSPNRAGVH